ADFFDAAASAYGDAKVVSNWLMTDFLALVNSEKRAIEAVAMTPAQLVEMLKLIDAGTISRNIAKSAFEELLRTRKPAAQNVAEKGLTQISDEGELERVVATAMAEPAQGG